MRQLLNTLFVTTPRSYLHLDHDTVRVEVERVLKLQAPLLQLGSIVCFGDALVSSALLARCAEDGRSVVFLSANGRFQARLEGPTSGNVLLRRAQHLALGDARRLGIVRNVVAGKLRNSRFLLLRAAREARSPEEAAILATAADEQLIVLDRLEGRTDVDLIRGDEGIAARAYFGVFSLMIRAEREAFAFVARSRRPPLDRINAVLSFLYTLLRADCTAALEGVGLDPQIGFLHALRPGRPALSLDLMEELRPVIADRLALSLINRRQLTPGDFTAHEGGAVYLSDAGRKTVIVGYQKRKEEEVEHRLLGGKTPIGLIPHLQARVLARTLRGDLEHYIPYVAR